MTITLEKMLKLLAILEEHMAYMMYDVIEYKHEADYEEHAKMAFTDIVRELDLDKQVFEQPEFLELLFKLFEAEKEKELIEILAMCRE